MKLSVDERPLLDSGLASSDTGQRDVDVKRDMKKWLIQKILSKAADSAAKLGHPL